MNFYCDRCGLQSNEQRIFSTAYYLIVGDGSIKEQWFFCEECWMGVCRVMAECKRKYDKVGYWIKYNGEVYTPSSYSKGWLSVFSEIFILDP